MNFKVAISLSISLFLFLMTCQKQTENPAIDAVALIKQVKDKVGEFHKADTTLNAKGILDLLWPEFTMLVDGNRITYQDVKASTKGYMASLETFHTEWDDLKIIPIGNHHAISSFIFTDSIVAKDGTITKNRGPNTFVWERRKEEWKVLYGDADHYPVKNDD